MKTVCNATPIISLSSVNKLDILKELFHKIIIPEAVYNEIRAKESYGFKEVESDFINVEQINPHDRGGPVITPAHENRFSR